MTLRPPQFLPDDVDGRALFEIATNRRRARAAGESDTGGVAGLGDIVMVDSVRKARERHVLALPRPIRRNSSSTAPAVRRKPVDVDTIIWCTGFRPALHHLAPLGLRGPDGLIPTDGTQATKEPRLHLIGYGDWTARPQQPSSA